MQFPKRTYQRMQLVLWIQAITWSAIGVCLLWFFISSDNQRGWEAVLSFSTALLFPAAWYLLATWKYLHSDREGLSYSDGALPLVIFVSLYLPLTVIVGDAKAFLFLPAFWLFCASIYPCLRVKPAASSDSAVHPEHRLERWLTVTSRVFPSPVIVLSGAILMGYSFWIERPWPTLLSGKVFWISAEFGLGAYSSATRLFLGIFGRLVYGASLLLAACAVIVLFVYKLSAAAMRVSRVVAVLAAAGAFLAICSMTDHYFSWIYYTSDYAPVLPLILITLFFAHWMMPLLFLVAAHQSRQNLTWNVEPELKMLIAFYTPIFLFDLAMSPFFVNFGIFSSPFFPAAFLGLQFLCWGFLGLSRHRLLDPAEVVAVPNQAHLIGGQIAD